LLILSSNNWPDAYEVRPRKDRRGVDLISDALPFGRLINDPAELLADPREGLEPGADPSQLFAKGSGKMHNSFGTFRPRRQGKPYDFSRRFRMPPF
jgi:hypothetical protein